MVFVLGKVGFCVDFIGGYFNGLLGGCLPEVFEGEERYVSRYFLVLIDDRDDFQLLNLPMIIKNDGDRGGGV